VRPAWPSSVQLLGRILGADSVAPKSLSSEWQSNKGGHGCCRASCLRWLGNCLARKRAIVNDLNGSRALNGGLQQCSNRKITVKACSSLGMSRSAPPIGQNWKFVAHS